MRKKYIKKNIFINESEEIGYFFLTADIKIKNKKYTEHKTEWWKKYPEYNF